jgi:hypothetical protein
VTSVDRTSRQLLLVVGLFGVFYAVLARVGFHAFPFSGDEYSYVFQAELFAHGRLRAPAPPNPELLRVDHVVVDAWVRSKYPPGTAALLAIGVRAGVPWLVTPLEGVVTLLAMGAAARRVLGDRDAVRAVALLGAAPLFAFQAATFYSHTAATMWLALAFAAVTGWARDARRASRGWRLVAAGVAVGCALLTRPLDAALFAAALLSLRSASVVLRVAAGASPFVALQLAYQAVQFGSPFADGYKAYEPTFRAIYGAHTAAPAFSLYNLVDGEQLWHHLDILRAFLVDWTVPGTALLALLGWAALQSDPEVATARRVSVALLALFAASLFVTIGGTDDGARPRYLSTTLVPLALFAAPGWRAAADLLALRVGKRALRIVAGVVCVVPVIQLGAFLVDRTPSLWIREGLEQAVAAEGISGGIVVVRAEYPTRYARNGPFFDRPVLYVSAPATTSADEVGAAFPGRPVYEAHEGKRWTVTRVR